MDAERSDLTRWAEAKAFVERLLPPGTEVLIVSEKLEEYGRTVGRILLRAGRDVGAELLKAGLAKPGGVMSGTECSARCFTCCCTGFWVLYITPSVYAAAVQPLVA